MSRNRGSGMPDQILELHPDGPQRPGYQAPNEVLPAGQTLAQALQPAPGRIVPTKGRARRQYERNVRKNKADPRDPTHLLVPPLGKKEQREYLEWVERERERQREEYREYLIEALRFLANLGITPVISFVNIKSATKTSNALGVGNVIAQFTRKRTLILPASTNSATGTLGLMSGVHGVPITFSEYSRNLKEFGVPRTLSRRVPLTPWGLGVIIEDANSAADEDDDLAAKQFLDTVDTTLPNVDVLILDHGNDNISKLSIVLQAARISHTLNLPFKFDDPVTGDMLERTMAGYSTDNGIPEDVETSLYAEFENRRFTGLDTLMSEKLRRSIIIATKAKIDEAVDFRALATPVIQGAHAQGIKQWDGVGIRVPTDPSVGKKDDKGRLMPFNLDALQRDTLIAYLEIAVANFEAAAPLQGFDLSSYNYTPTFYGTQV